MKFIFNGFLQKHLHPTSILFAPIESLPETPGNSFFIYSTFIISFVCGNKSSFKKFNSNLLFEKIFLKLLSIAGLNEIYEASFFAYLYL